MAFPGAKTTVYEAGLRVPFIVRTPRAANRGIANHAMISHADITPSLVDFAGGYDPAENAPKTLLPTPKPGIGENPGKPVTRYHGRSWLPILESETPAGWDTLGASHTFHEIQMYYPMRAWRNRTHKIIWNIAHGLPYPFATDLWAASTWQAQFQKGPDAPYGGRTVQSYIHRPAFELFDLSNDPAEANNLAADPAHAALLETMKSRLKAFQTQTADPWVLKWSYE